ncbi:MAG: efflux RND transporter periplasmic adaptor subunit [Xanthobacteraceae bacterium]
MGAVPELGTTEAHSLQPDDIEKILGVGKRGASRFLQRRNLFWAAVAAAAIIGGYGLWSLSGSRAAVSYVTAPATRSNMTVVVTATGSAQPITQVNVSSELSGTIRKVLVDYNSPVKRDQPLAELDTDKLKATVQSVQAKLDAAKARVVDAAATIEEKRSEYERKQTLAEKQIASDKELDLAKAAYDRAVAAHASALAEVEVVQADLRLNEINLAKACICSPIDGVVLKRSVDPGQIVASSLQAPVLFVIAQDLRQMELQVDIDEADVGKVKVGQKAAFSVDAYPERKFPAEIRDIRFGSETVQGVVTYKAVLAIDNSDLLIRPGMTATAEIVVQEVKDALLVPNPALRFSPSTPNSQQSGNLLQLLLPRPPSASMRPPSKQETGSNRTVWVLKDGAPAAVAVTIGATDGRSTEILKGEIAADQPVIVDSVTAKR